MIFDADINDVFRFLEGHAAALFGIEAIHREAAKIAFGVADVGDSELQIAGAAVVEDVAEELERAGFAPADGREGWRGRSSAGKRRAGWSQGSGFHAKLQYCRRKMALLANLSYFPAATL